jgi:hypothetical protein
MPGVERSADGDVAAKAAADMVGFLDVSGMSPCFRSKYLTIQFYQCIK